MPEGRKSYALSSILTLSNLVIQAEHIVVTLVMVSTNGIYKT